MRNLTSFLSNTPVKGDSAYRGKWTVGASAPGATGEPRAVGDIHWHTDPRDGSPVGWIATTAGDPPTWTAFGATDVTYVPTTADVAINSVTDVTVVTRDVTGVAAGDQVMVDAWFTILNNSSATRVYTITLDFDGLFDIEIATGACATSATLMHPFRVTGVCDVRSASLSYGMVFVDSQLAAGIAAGGDTTIAATHLQGKGWGTSTTDATGTLTTALKIRSADATATQTLRLHHLSVRKLSPT